ncbi:MAG: transporter, ATP-binding protein, partial [Ilumatobacteraceae bacterium]|nr:transporter, ATP-binding protein [Ilumatobacteraceae bacterium]
MLEVGEIRKRFGDVVALDGVSLSVGAGAIVGFLGPNGAGKSTTMRAVMGLISIDSGAITWKGLPITAATRRRFGYMPAERGMYPKMTVRDQLVYFARLAGLTSAQAAAAAETWMRRVDITHRADDEVQALSSGNQQRVQLAIALVHDPELLILDEPFSGLDPLAVETMKTILADELNRGTSVLFSSHQL